MLDVDTVASLKARRNGNGARPNFRKPDIYSHEPRDTTDAFLKLAAGLDTDKPQIAWWRRLQVWELALLTLGTIGLIVMAWR